VTVWPKPAIKKEKSAERLIIYNSNKIIIDVYPKIASSIDLHKWFFTRFDRFSLFRNYSPDPMGETYEQIREIKWADKKYEMLTLSVIREAFGLPVVKWIITFINGPNIVIGIETQIGIGEDIRGKETNKILQFYNSILDNVEFWSWNEGGKAKN
jgi:hypothetical protein